MLKFLKSEKIKQVYNFSGKSFKEIDEHSALKQSFYGSVSMKEIFVKSFSDIKSDTSFIVGSSYRQHYSLFQKQGCRGALPSFSKVVLSSLRL